METTLTSESVAAGHPDKICDQISDAILDAAIAADPKSRVAVETMVTTDRIALAGEVTCAAALDYEAIASGVVRDLGYTDTLFGFTDRSPVTVWIHQQSPDIAVGVDDGGAGDQGMMVGYATNETPELMPLPLVLSHRLVESMDTLRTSGRLPYLRPDGKAQVTLRYKNGRVTVETVVLAVPHKPDVAVSDVTTDLIRLAVDPVLEAYGLSGQAPVIIVNGTGKWDIGGPASDTGVTGRKIIVDTYGSAVPHGGGAFSGKDPTKVDRSAAYAARYVAKNIVASGRAKRCMVRVAYVIGRRGPVDQSFECFGTGTSTAKDLAAYAATLTDFSVSDIIGRLDLRRPIYRNSARYGHFGRPGFPWEAVAKSG
jgi:S-adenosylmethionine synthetase